MFYPRPHRADAHRHPLETWNFSPAATQCTDDVSDDLDTARGSPRAGSRGAGLIALARRGDAVAFSRLFASFERDIFRYAAHMCGRDAADDVVQETFLAVLRGTGHYDASKGSVGNYLFGIARHCALKRLKACDARTFELTEDDLSSTILTDANRPSVLDSLSREETIKAVRAAIGSLPAPYREVVVLCELQEMSYVDAAAIVQCPVGTVRSRLHRARSLLTAKLGGAHAEVALRKSV